MVIEEFLSPQGITRDVTSDVTRSATFSNVQQPSEAAPGVVWPGTARAMGSGCFKGNTPYEPLAADEAPPGPPDLSIKLLGQQLMADGTPADHIYINICNNYNVISWVDSAKANWRSV